MKRHLDRLRQRLARAANHPRVLFYSKRAVQAFPRLDHYVRLAHYGAVKRIKPMRAATIEATSGQVPQLLVDISHVAKVDGKTGIERVVRSLLIELVRNPPEGFRVVPVQVDSAGQLVSAAAFVAVLLVGSGDAATGEKAIRVQRGDIWFTPDFETQYPESVLTQLREHGVRIIFTVYDLLPLRTPEHFYQAQNLRFADWLAMVMRTADGVLCDSRTVADDLRAWLDEHPRLRAAPLQVGHFHLGADIAASGPTSGMTPVEQAILRSVKNAPTLLMVGTIEPRKGHRFVLAAMEALWRRGDETQLVIVGKEGWRSHDITRALTVNPVLGKRLFWLSRASDELLEELYANASALVAASANEGFGLPLIEAAQHGLPIIARDIPVFREVAGDHAFYFSDDRPEQLASTFARWFALARESRAPSSRPMPILRWADSAAQVVSAIIGDRWDHVWSPPSQRRKVL